MTNKPKIAVVLSGCGVYDGSEIHEAVLTLLALDRHQAEAHCFAPDIAQWHVVDHRSGEVTGESRNVLTESARIARGKISDLADYRPEDFDALIFPGGFGAAKNLSDFAQRGAACTVQPTVEQAIRATHQAGKPIGALCIAPVLLARLLPGVELTIGDDADTAAAIDKMGGNHQICGRGLAVIDRANRVVTSPCYMLESSIGQIADGAEAVVKAVLNLAGATA